MDGVQSVRRALQLLSLFTPRHAQWSVTAMAQATGLHKSVVARLMATMAREGFVVQDPASRTYAVGPQAFAVGSTFRPYTVLEQLMHPVLEDLARRSGHSASLGVPAGGRFITLLSVESSRALRLASEAGEQPFYHSASVGKALLAAMQDDQVCEVVGPDPLPKVTPYTVDSLDVLLRELAEARRCGYAVSRQESIIGVGGVAAGITDANGRCIAGVGVAYPVHLVDDAEVSELGLMVADTAKLMSRQLNAVQFRSSE